MGDKVKIKIGFFAKTFICIILLMGYFKNSYGFPAEPYEDRFVDRGANDTPSPRMNQLATWLIDQIRKSDDLSSRPDLPILPYRISLNGKRNSELTSSIMGLPRTMIDNGKK